MLADMFGNSAVGKLVKGDKISLRVNDIEASINISTLVCTTNKNPASFMLILIN